MLGLKIVVLLAISPKEIARARLLPGFSTRSVGSYMDGANQNLSYKYMQNSTGQWVTLMIMRLSKTKWRRGMQYRRGMSSHAKMLLGAMYENKASFFTMEMVLMAKRNLYTYDT
jgi:hypothetical protein